SSQLQFRGQDATECEDFIQTISKYAFSQGKQRDDQWIADLAATCMTNDALRWWGALDEEVQGSWKLVRRAMLSKYRPMFQGASGEEAEKFIREVCDKAMDEGKQEDNKWIVTYASSCLAGEALRWYTYLDSETKHDREELQHALLTQYSRGGSYVPALHLIPTPAAATPAAATPAVTVPFDLTGNSNVTQRRGRMRVSNSNCTIPNYLSKRLLSDNRIRSTPYLEDALELEWSTSLEGLPTLSIPGVSYDRLYLIRRVPNVVPSRKYRDSTYLELGGVPQVD
ncbi:hypothetical protein FRC01_007306, partial [Tulasnella sp. 417]